jgi:hypothetical protein
LCRIPIHGRPPRITFEERNVPFHSSLALPLTAALLACGEFPTQESTEQLDATGPHISVIPCRPAQRDEDGERHSDVIVIDGPSICGRYGAYVLVINDRILNTAGSASCLNALDPAAIESVDILKPAAAAALYGTAARTGAIVIALKKGMKSPCDP